MSNIEYDYISNDYIVDENGNRIIDEVGFPEPVLYNLYMEWFEKFYDENAEV